MTFVPIIGPQGSEFNQKNYKKEKYFERTTIVHTFTNTDIIMQPYLNSVNYSYCENMQKSICIYCNMYNINRLFLHIYLTQVKQLTYEK